MKSSRRAPEGKTLADPGKTRKCDNCDAPNGQYYCKECNFVYCPVCEKGHKRNKFTDHHKSTPLADISVSNLEGKMSALNLGTCTRHNKTITSTCHKCLTVICDDCAASHSGHEVRPCSNDGRIIQKICRAQTQSLYDALEMTENNQDCARKRKSLCDQTRKKIRETVTLIIDEATKLGKSIEKDLDKIEQEGDDKEIEVAAYAKKVDTKVARLTSIRNVTDVTVLVPEAAETAGILDELVVIKNMAADLDIRDATVSDVLPDIGTVDKLLDDMKIALHINAKFGNKSKSGMGAVGGSIPIRVSTRLEDHRYDLVSKLGTISIKNAERDCHRMCDTGRYTREHIILHGIGGTDIHKFNPATGSLDTTACEYGIWNMVETADGEYVAVNSSGQKLLILDNKFKVKYTMPESDTITIQAICYHSLNTFLMLQNNSSDPNTTTLTQVEVTSNRFVKRQKVEVTTKDKPFFMCLHPDADKLYLVSDTYMYIVNMAHSSVETQDVSGATNGFIYSVYVDASSNILIGDDEGVLHLFDRDMEHRVVAEVGEQINGVTVREDVLYVTAGREIHKYRITRE